MMTGSYIGGGVNFAALSTKFQTPGELVSATVVADNSVMAFYFIVLITLPNITFIKNILKDFIIQTMLQTVIKQKRIGNEMK